jgi:outer membrane protein assembly factor BamB
VFTAIDAKSGEIAWQYRLGAGHLLASPVVDEKQVYIGNMAGLVVALTAK